MRKSSSHFVTRAVSKFTRRSLRMQSLESRRLLAGDAWTQRGGDAGHDQYVPETIDPAAISEALVPIAGVHPEWHRLVARTRSCDRRIAGLSHGVGRLCAVGDGTCDRLRFGNRRGELASDVRHSRVRGDGRACRRRWHRLRQQRRTLWHIVDSGPDAIRSRRDDGSNASARELRSPVRFE